jgi:hypothetical protein
MTVAGESHNIGTKLGFMGITDKFELNKTATLYMKSLAWWALPKC